MMNLSKKTKIIATIGPSSDNYETLLEMARKGMNVMRLNFSHGTYDEHLIKINLARRLRKENNILVSIMLDTKGPEIRCHYFKNGGVTIEKDSIVRIGMDDVMGDEKLFSVTYPGLFDDIKVNDTIKIDDGKLQLTVIDKDHKTKQIVAKAFNTHYISNRKGINIPSARLKLPALSEIDEKDILFSCQNGIDMIAASFIRNKENVLQIKEYLKSIGYANIPVIAKIENEEGFQNINEILTVVDGVMVARGDLGVEIPAEFVPILQRQIIKACRKVGKPVITATQMLDSMQTNPIPTRAEVSDVATAIEESSDAIMLSGETASGQYPVESVAMQAKIAATIEQYLDYSKLAQEAFLSSEKKRSDAIANSVANTANLIDAKLIFCFSENGSSAKKIAKTRPKCPIIMVTNKSETAFTNGLTYAIYPVLIRVLPQFIEDMEAFSIIMSREFGLKKGDPIIITGGIPTGSGGTNFMRIVLMNEVKDV